MIEKHFGVIKVTTAFFNLAVYQTMQEKVPISGPVSQESCSRKTPNLRPSQGLMQL